MAVAKIQLGEFPSVGGKNCGKVASSIILVLHVALDTGYEEVSIGKGREGINLQVSIQSDGRSGRAVGRKVQRINAWLQDAALRNLIHAAVGRRRKSIRAIQPQI